MPLSNPEQLTATQELELIEQYMKRTYKDLQKAKTVGEKAIEKAWESMNAHLDAYNMVRAINGIEIPDGAEELCLPESS